jgi:hypothetical protein
MKLERWGRQTDFSGNSKLNLKDSDTSFLSQVKLQCKDQRLMQPRGCNVHVSLSWTLTRLRHFCNNPISHRKPARRRSSNSIREQLGIG